MASTKKNIKTKKALSSVNATGTTRTRSKAKTISTKRSVAKKTATTKTATKKAVTAKTTAKKAATAKTAAKKAVTAKTTAKKAATKTTAKKAVTAKTTAKKAATKTTAKKAATAKTDVKKAATKKIAAAKTANKKAAATKTATAKTTTKKAATAKTAATKTVVAKKTTIATATKKAVTAETISKKIQTSPAITKMPSAALKTTPIPHIDLGNSQPKTTDNYMNAEQLAHFRKLLETRKRELMEQAEATLRDMQVASEENQADISDIATSEERWYYQLRTRDRERKLIKKIEESIQKIASQEYGYCESCGVEIGLNRLEARPTATQCIDCKTLDEIREKTKAD